MPAADAADEAEVAALDAWLDELLAELVAAPTVDPTVLPIFTPEVPEPPLRTPPNCADAVFTNNIAIATLVSLKKFRFIKRV